MDWLSVLPPIIAIVVVLWKKEVISALFVALLSAEILILSQHQQSVLLSPISVVDRVVATVSSVGNTRLLLFSLLVGALMAFMKHSGGVAAFVSKLIDSGFIKSKKRASLVTMFTGTLIFIESNLSVLTSGIMARGLFDKFKMSRARLAYIIDSTSAPVCILILLNGWGAYVLGLISTYELSENPLLVLWKTIPYNIYAWLTLLVVLYTILSDSVHGPMREAERTLEKLDSDIEGEKPTKARYMIVPLLVMIIGMLSFMVYTGDGDITQGSGSKSVLYATFLASLVGAFMLIFSRQSNSKQTLKIGFSGMSELLPLVTILMLSIVLGNSLKELGTGAYVATLVGEYLPYALILPVIFITGSIISFTTGTSWGTFGILVPIGIPIAMGLNLPPELILAAILGGGIFGDHCSPLSDTTAVSSLAAGVDILTHVKTQLPYALIVGIASILFYTMLGLVLFL